MTPTLSTQADAFNIIENFYKNHGPFSLKIIDHGIEAQSNTMFLIGEEGVCDLYFYPQGTWYKALNGKVTSIVFESCKLGDSIDGTRFLKNVQKHLDLDFISAYTGLLTVNKQNDELFTEDGHYWKTYYKQVGKVNNLKTLGFPYYIYKGGEK